MRYKIACFIVSILLFVNFAIALTPISNCAGLQNIKNNLNENYYLTQDIDCTYDTQNPSGVLYNAGRGFEPIGGWNIGYFRGKLDGRNHTITGLFMNRHSYSNGDNFYVSLFEGISGGSVENLGLEDAHYIGTADSGREGGMACSIAGILDNGAYINKSYVKRGLMETRGEGYASGLVCSVGTNSRIENSYFQGRVVGGNDVKTGGIASFSYRGVIKNSYSFAQLSGEEIGGVIFDYYQAYAYNSYWDAEYSGISFSALGSGKTTNEMKRQSTYNTWDFNNIWGINEGNSYPYLLWEVEPVVPEIPCPNGICGTGESCENCPQDCGECEEEVVVSSCYPNSEWMITGEDVCSDTAMAPNIECDYVSDGFSQTNWFGFDDSVPKFTYGDLGGKKCIDKIRINITDTSGLEETINVKVSDTGIAGSWRNVLENAVIIGGDDWNEVLLPQSTYGKYVLIELTSCDSTDANLFCNIRDYEIETRDYIGYCAEDNIIMKLFYPTNSHGAVWNDNHGYDYNICYKNIFGFDGAGNRECEDDESNVLVWLSDEFNSHASLTETSVYDIPICYKGLSCEAKTDPTPCSADYQTVVRLDTASNAHISNSSDTNFPIKICCMYNFVPELYWQDMNNKKINKANVSDRVKLVAQGNLAGREIKFTLKECEAVCQITGGVVKWFDREVESVVASEGYLTWRAEETGKYYFISEIDGVEYFSLDYDYGTLEVLNENNFQPIANITSPIGGIYFASNNIIFNQSSYDEDDFMDYTWDLGNGVKKTGSTRNYLDYSFAYSYLNLGQKKIKLNVSDERGLKDSDAVDILVIDSSQDRDYVFADIRKPEWEEMINGNTVEFNASTSYAIRVETGLITCLGGACPYTTSNGITIFDSLNKRGDYSDLNFSWKFDDSDYYSRKGIDGASFRKTFVNDDWHWARLNVSITDANSVSETTFRVKFISYCDSRGLTWWDSEGISHNTLNELNYCKGLNGVVGGGDDCCPSNWYCDSVSLKCKENAGEQIYSCLNYTDEDSCEDDEYNMGSEGAGSENCGRLVPSIEICGAENFVSMQCRCDWNGSQCLLKSRLSGTVYDSVPIEHDCEIIPNHGVCVDGYMNLQTSARIIWDSLTLSEVISHGFAGNDEEAEDFLEENCNLDELCSDRTEVVLCGEGLIKLAFFTIGNLIISALILIGIYIGWNYIKKKRRKNKRK